MNKLIPILLLAITVISGHTFAKTRLPASTKSIDLNCAPPKNFAGASATVKGTLKLKKLSNGAFQGEGKLDISILGARGVVWSGKKKALGQYDDLSSIGSERYFHGGVELDAEKFVAVYANFTSPDLSYVEYDGQFYKMSCE